MEEQRQRIADVGQKSEKVLSIHLFFLYPFR
jgi:hypothetical protein